MNEHACREEVFALHRFFESWFQGSVANDDATFDRFASALAPEFEMVAPDGSRMARADLIERLRRAHGFQRGARETFSMRIEGASARKLASGLWLVAYDEWQRTGAGDRGRRSSALLRESADAPRGFLWLHIHETWLPAPPSGPR